MSLITVRDIISIVMKHYFRLSCFLSSLVLHVVSQQVTLPTGRIQGHFLSSRDGRQFAAYEGIPYGQAPTGELRFRPPVAAAAWEGVRNCTVEPPVCPQTSTGPDGEAVVVGDEDCLHLNVYQPTSVGIIAPSSSSSSSLS